MLEQARLGKAVEQVKVAFQNDTFRKTPSVSVQKVVMRHASATDDGFRAMLHFHFIFFKICCDRLVGQSMVISLGQTVCSLQRT